MMGLGFRADPNLHRAGIGPFRVRIEARQRWVAPARVSNQTWLDVINLCSVPPGKDDDWRVPGGGEAEHAVHEIPKKPNRVHQGTKLN